MVIRATCTFSGVARGGDGGWLIWNIAEKSFGKLVEVWISWLRSKKFSHCKNNDKKRWIFRKSHYICQIMSRLNYVNNLW